MLLGPLLMAWYDRSMQAPPPRSASSAKGGRGGGGGCHGEHRLWMATLGVVDDCGEASLKVRSVAVSSPYRAAIDNGPHAPKESGDDAAPDLGR